MKTISSIYLLRSNKVLPLHDGDLVSDPRFVPTIVKNFEALGYRMSADVIQMLDEADQDSLLGWYNDTFPALQEAVGAHVKHEPMYPNFPAQVMDASEATLYINAVMHYLGDIANLRIMPVYDKNLRVPLDEWVNLRELTLGSVSDMLSMFESLINSKSSYSEQDQEDITSFAVDTAEGYKGLFNHGKSFSEVINTSNLKNKENIAFLVSMCHALELDVNYSKLLRTATDILRFAVEISGGDVSLAEAPKFSKFKRADRRLILSLLEQAGEIEEDMLRYKEYWKRLGEFLHPGEYASRYPKAAEAFRKLRNNEKIVTFNSLVEGAIKDKEVNILVDLLSKRPGEFARRLDQVVSMADSPLEVVVPTFGAVANKVAPTVLLQVMTHFKNKIDNPSDYRVVIPKGQVSKVRVNETSGREVADYVSDEIVNVCKSALKEIFSSYGSMDRVYVDPALKDIAVPTGLRNSSKALDTFGRGSRLAFSEDKNTLRFFIHWKDMDSTYDGWNKRVDVDLSATRYDKNFVSKGELAYYNLRTYGAYHSGDITSAPNGASEFIDIDIEKSLRDGVRYIGMVVYSYTGQRLSDVPEAFAGFMTRERSQSGEVFEPSTVDSKLDLTVESTNAMPYIFDLKERKAIWVDLAVTSRHHYGSNVHGNKDNLQLALEALVKQYPVNLYDLFTLHAEARGTRVFEREEADTVFALDGDVTPKDVETILDLYL